MKTKKISKASKRRIIFFGLPALFIIVSFIIGTTDSIINIIKLKNQTKQLEQQLYMLKNDEEDLNTEITKLQDPDYIARFAREKYLYSKDGEYVIRIDDKETDEVINNNNVNYKVVYTIASIIGITVIYIIRKKLIWSSN